MFPLGVISFPFLSTFSITEPLALFSPVARLFTAFVLPPFTSGVFLGGLFEGLVASLVFPGILGTS